MSEDQRAPMIVQQPSGADRPGRYRYRAHRIGRLILTTCQQATTHRLFDPAWIEDQDGFRYRGRAIPLRPWRRDEWGAIREGRALVIGWRRP